MTASANATTPKSAGTSSRASTSVAAKTRTLPPAYDDAAHRKLVKARRPRSRIRLHQGLADMTARHAGVVPERAPQTRHERLRHEHPYQESRLALGEREGIECDGADGVAPGDALVALDRAPQSGMQVRGRGRPAPQQSAFPCGPDLAQVTVDDREV